MKTFFLILLFGKQLLLTPAPVSFDDSFEILPEKPIEAITSGASLEIDITSMVAEKYTASLFEYWSTNGYQSEFPKNSIFARLEREDGQAIVVEYKGNAAISNQHLWLQLGSTDGVPVGVGFRKVTIYSEVPLRNVKIYWKNYRH